MKLLKIRYLILIALACFALLANTGSTSASEAANDQSMQVFIDQTLPGLHHDTQTLRFELTSRTQIFSVDIVQQRHDADQALAKALAKAQAEPDKNQTAGAWDAVAQAAKTRLMLGQSRHPSLWLTFGAAMLHGTNPDPQRALEASYQAYEYRLNGTNPAQQSMQALQQMRDALEALHNNLAALKLLGQIVRANPADTQDAALLQQSFDRIGYRVTKINTTPDAFPAGACVTFTIPLPSDPDFHPGDYVSTEPALKTLAVTSENGQLCLAGLPAGATTTVTLRAGMPGLGGAKLGQALTFKITLPDRQAKLIADTAHYIIPASNPPVIGLASVNISKVKIQIGRVAERSLLQFLQNHPLANPDGYNNSLNGNSETIIFQGKADIPDFARNHLVHTILPLAAQMKKPGLYAVSINPDDGTPRYALGTLQMVLRTDLAPSIWRGADGMHVQIRSFTSAEPVAHVQVNLIAADNEILASGQTDSQGLVTFAAPLLAGNAGQAPTALHILAPDDDFTLFDLTASPFDLSDRGVGGAAQPGPIDPYIWLDRGIYRPGETVNVSALLRSPDGKNLDIPLHLIIRRPGGQVFSDTIPARTDDDAIIAPIKLSPGAQAGVWSITLATSLNAPALATHTFMVESFVPATLAVSLGKAAPLTPQAINPFAFNARFLYGAPGANLSATASVHLAVDPAPFAALAGYRFGLQSEIFDAPTAAPAVPDTDARGDGTVPIDLTKMPDSSHPLQAILTVNVNDPAGRAVSKTINLPIRPASPLLGIKPAFTGEAVNQGQSAQFDIIAASPQGAKIAMTADLSVVSQDEEWNIIWNNQVARWDISFIDRPVMHEQISIPAGGAFHLALPALPYGRYRLRVVQADGGLAASSMIFYSGWVFSGNPSVPSRVTVASDHATYLPGETAHLHITAPFAGPATLVIANDGVKSIQNITVGAKGADVSVPVSAQWGAGAYAIVHVFQPARAAKPGETIPPDRAIGLTWLGLKPGDRALPVSMAVQPVYLPRQTVTIDVKTKPGAYVTLAAVDEGVLQLTNFTSPDPLAHFFGKRSLGVDIADDYAALLRPPSGQSLMLKNGAGGDFGASQPPIPQKIVSLFAGPVQAGPDGVAHITLALPDFDGQIRLMAVGWQGRAVGAASSDIIVRDKVVAETLLPRFLAPGDQADIGILLQNLDLPDGVFVADLTASGALAGTSHIQLDLAPGVRHVLPASLTATRLGTGHVTLAITGPNGYHTAHESELSVHVARAPVTRIAASTIAPGASLTLQPDATGFIPGSVSASLTLGDHLPFDPAGYMQALAGMRYRFLEASVSRGLPLTALSGPAAGPDPQGQLAAAVQDVLDDQRYDGAFGLWSSQDDAQPWLTAYATEFLLRARKAGATVPQPPLDSALSWLRQEISQDGGPAQQADIYAAYVLALDGEAPAGAIRMMDQNIGKIDHPLARAQLGAALNYIGEPDAARAALRAALDLSNRGGDFWWRGQDWMAGYGTPLRDGWAVPAVIAQTGLLADKMPALFANIPGAGIDVDTLSAQELGWAGFAAGVIGGKPTKLDLTIGGASVTSNQPVTRSLTGPLAITNTGPAPVPALLATSGIPAQAPAAAAHGMELTQHFFSLDGTPLNVGQLPQNQVFVMLISGRALDSTPHHAVLVAGLPAGWEIAGNLASGNVTGMDWLGSLTTPRAKAAADDRYMVALNLTPPYSDPTTGQDNGDDREFRVAVMLRAVTQGHFTLPGVTLTDLNHPLINAVSASRPVVVLPPH